MESAVPAVGRLTVHHVMPRNIPGGFAVERKDILFVVKALGQSPSKAKVCCKHMTLTCKWLKESNNTTQHAEEQSAQATMHAFWKQLFDTSHNR